MRVNRTVALSALVTLLAASSWLLACGGNNAPTGARVRIVLQADLSQLTAIDPEAALDTAADIIERRIDAYGASANVRREGANRISVELAGIDAGDAQELTAQRGLLEFREPKQDARGDILLCEGGTVIHDPPGCEGGQEAAVPPQSSSQAEESIVC